ncbi:DUF1156 domain-containing protein [Thermus albus]|uniref:DUF1156 domain-containing protein n=1 Tax=Thermus albus TaxID=2908146 RepID=UPI001FAA0933|nr:DUF1156 domain-containing protein [Thermus albus]
MAKKLIEVALPLKEINREASREKSIRHGHPSTLHLWWARRPLATARAVLFATLVDDPGTHLPEAEAHRERERLFKLIGQLVNWDNVKDPERAQVVAEAQYEIAKSLAHALGEAPPSSSGDKERIQAILEKAPPVLDPFAGGGTIPLEAQRLGLRAYASDLNPVAVLINKALIEIPPRFAGRPPVNPEYQAKAQATDRFPGAKGLAQDVRYYGRRLLEKARERIGHLYPTLDGKTVIAWLWARTVPCPNPACPASRHGEHPGAPLLASLWLAQRKGKGLYLKPERDPSGRLRFLVETKGEPPVERTIGRKGGQCLLCGSPITLDHVRKEGKAGRMGAMLVAVVVEGSEGREYLPACPEQESLALGVQPDFVPGVDLPRKALGFRVQEYGMTKWHHLFTPRQLLALGTFFELVAEVVEECRQDALRAGLPHHDTPLAQGGQGALAYAQAVGVYLGLAVSRLADRQSSLCLWDKAYEKVSHVFNRQALPMVWDFAEANPFSNSTGSFGNMLEWVARALEALPAKPPGHARQANAVESVNGLDQLPIIVTDPPYYDNVPYADLSDFFYIWLRKTLQDTYPDLFRTLLTPKAEELVADPYRHGDKERAKRHFEEGMRQVFHNLRAKAHPDYPLTLYYAFKQQEDVGPEEAGVEADSDPLLPVSEGATGQSPGPGLGRTSTGWETFLQALVDAGFQITATWPMRTELSNRPRGQGANALSSSIILVCRPRASTAPTATREAFLRALRQELKEALANLTQEGIPPVDLAQSAIGPGMAVFSRYGAVREPTGRALSVREALVLINQVLDEFLAQDETELDNPTRFALAWYQQHGYEEGLYGDAETLAKAKNVPVASLEEAEILRAKGGKVRLLRPEEYRKDWDPAKDPHRNVWKVAHQLIRALKEEGEEAATRIVAALPSHLAEASRSLAYRLYQIAEKKGYGQDAQDFNLLADSYTHVAEEAAKRRPATQPELL